MIRPGLLGTSRLQFEGHVGNASDSFASKGVEFEYAPTSMPSLIS